MGIARAGHPANPRERRWGLGHSLVGSSLACLSLDFCVLHYEEEPSWETQEGLAQELENGHENLAAGWSN